MRVVQLTPPGSACSIVFGVGISDPDAPRVLNLHLVVDDIEKARAHLLSKHVDVSDVSDLGGIKYAFFSDPGELMGAPGTLAMIESARGSADPGNALRRPKEATAHADVRSGALRCPAKSVLSFRDNRVGFASRRS